MPSLNAMKYLVVAISDDRTTIRHSTTHDDSMLARVWFGSFRPDVLDHLDERGDSVSGVEGIGFARKHEVTQPSQHHRQVLQQPFRGGVRFTLAVSASHRHELVGCGPVILFRFMPRLILRMFFHCWLPA